MSTHWRSHLLRTLAVVAAKELRELLRDRRALVLLLVPAFITPLPAVAVGGLIVFAHGRQARQGIPVAVVNAEAAPELVRALAANPSLRLVPPSADPDAALRAGSALVVLIVPPDFGARLARQEQVTIAVRASDGYWLSSL